MKSFLKKYINKFYYAWCGLIDGMLHDDSIRLQIIIAFAVIIVCMFLSLSAWEWVLILAMILLVCAMEWMNSALEELCDAMFPTYDKRAKKIKDYAATAVLLVSLLAAVVGIYVIGGKLW